MSDVWKKGDLLKTTVGYTVLFESPEDVNSDKVLTEGSLLVVLGENQIMSRYFQASFVAVYSNSHSCKGWVDRTRVSKV